MNVDSERVSAVTPAWLAALAVGLLGAACDGQGPGAASAGAGPGGPAAEDVASVEVALTGAPSGVGCVEVDVTANGTTLTQRTSVTAGQTSIAFSNLAPGRTAFKALAFTVTSCTAVTSSTRASWQSDGTVVTLIAGQNPTVTLELRPTSSPTVSVDFCATPPCPTRVLATFPLTGTPINGDLLVTDNRVFFGDWWHIWSVPTDGGQAVPIVTSSSAINSGLATDGASLFWTRGDGALMRTWLSGGYTSGLASGAIGWPQVGGNYVYFDASPGLNGASTGVGYYDLSSGATGLLPDVSSTFTSGSRPSYVVTAGVDYYVSSSFGMQSLFPVFTGQSGDNISSLAVDDDGSGAVYIATGTAIVRATNSLGNPAPMRILTAPDGMTVYSRVMTSGSTLYVDKITIATGGARTSALIACQKPTCTGQTTIATIAGDLYAWTQDASFIYVLTMTNPLQLVRISK